MGTGVARIAAGIFAVLLLTGHAAAKDGFLRFKVPSESMLPTLEAGANFLATPVDANELQRGDVVVYLFGKRKLHFIFRVVAFGGETIEMEDGVVSVEGKAATYDDPQSVTLHGLRFCMGEEEGNACTLETVRETLPGGASHRVIRSRSERARNLTPVTVPEGHFYVLGDNRGNANDSRFGSGAVPPSDVRYLAKQLIVSPLKGLFREID